MQDKKEKFLELLKENYDLTFVEGKNLDSCKLKDLNLDSLDFAQIVYDIETIYNYRFSKAEEGDLADMTFGQLLNFLETVCTS